MSPMGCNFADIDNDGYPDFYLGTGWLSYSSLVPNLMFKNVHGRAVRGRDLSSGTGHLQKGHGVSFADWNGDGGLDLFVQTGGATPGDRAHNLLFQNPGHGRHWLAAKLVGTKTNRAAIEWQDQGDHQPDRRHRTIDLPHRRERFQLRRQHAGPIDRDRRGDASISELEVYSPTRAAQRRFFRNVDSDQTIIITEGSSRDQRPAKNEP